MLIFTSPSASVLDYLSVKQSGWTGWQEESILLVGRVYRVRVSVVHPSSMSDRVVSNYMLSLFRLSILSLCNRDAIPGYVRQRFADVSESYVPSPYRLRGSASLDFV